VRALDDEAAVRLLIGALERPSPSGEEGDVARFLCDAMRSFAPGAAPDAVGNAVASVGHGPRRVTLLGHIDTVGGWWGVRQEGDVIHGRGAFDAKGPFCTMIAAASRLSEEARERLSVRLVGAVEEEAPTSRGARHVAARHPRPDLVVIGEPSGWDAVTIGYKGRLVARLEARRASSHSARDDATPPEAVVAAWGAIRSWAAERSAGAPGAFDAVQAALLEIGSGGDGIEAWAHAVVALRLPPRCTPEEAEAHVRAAVAESGGDHEPALHVVTRFGARERAHRGPRDTTLTRVFRTAIRAHGGVPRLTLKTGTSDMNVVAPVWDVPMLAYGPGDAALDHTPEERLHVSEYLRAIAVLADALEALALTPAGEGRDG
jgi:[amino group carrier protein]-lysine/ornithine hydrolase